MSSFQQASSKVIAPRDGRVAGAALLVTLAVGLALSWHELGGFAHLLGIVSCAILAVMLYQTTWALMVLHDDVLVVQDRIRRVRRIPYGVIWRITYVRQTVFSLDTEAYGVVWFNPNAPGLEDFIGELSARIMRHRESVELSGDLEIDPS